MESFIREKARELGFSACGFTDCSDLLSEQSLFEQWLSEGRQADMAYLERHMDIRFHPSLLAEGCTYVVVALLNYHRPESALASKSAYKVAEYAWGMDYHKVMREKLHALAQCIQGLSKGVRTRCCVDTAPVLEKALAIRAGLGWRGKNSLLVTEQGSKYFIGEVFHSLPLCSDTPQANACGSCTACVEACPASALSETGTLDARRCLSYQTIERKNLLLPVGIQGAQGEAVFGCDACQNACPYNREAPVTQVAEFLQDPPWTSWTDADWQSLRAADFERYFADSALQRIGYEKLMENIRSVSMRDA